jgi:hypothetical protein
MKRVVFLICAQMQSGKDTFGAPLAEALGADVLSFADPLKEIAVILGVPPRVAYGGEKERRGWKKLHKSFGREADGREWLQWLGTEFGRNQVGIDIWIELLLGRCGQATVVTDARFKNELFKIEQVAERLGLEIQFVRIRLVRPGQSVSDAHPSEAEQLSIPTSAFDEIVVNSGTIADLEEKARKIADKYRYLLAS